MSNNQVVPLFGGVTTQQGQKVNGSLARQLKREVETLAVNTEIAAVREQAYAFLASQAMSNAATLLAQAEAHMTTSPAGAHIYETIITGYAIGAGRRIAGGL